MSIKPGKACSNCTVSRNGVIALKFLRPTGRRVVVMSLIPRDPVPQKPFKLIVNPSTPPLRELGAAVAQGRRGILLLGFTPQEESRIRDWLNDVESSLPVVRITDHGECSLREAVERAFDSPFPTQHEIVVDQNSYEGRVVFLSGLNGQEMVGLAETWGDFTGTEPAFASIVDNLLDRRLGSVVPEILQTAHRSATAQQNSSTIVINKSVREVSNVDNLRDVLRQAARTEGQKRRHKQQKPLQQNNKGFGTRK